MMDSRLDHAPRFVLGGATPEPIAAGGPIHRAVTFLVESGAWVSLVVVALGAWASLATRDAIDWTGLTALGLFLFAIFGLDRFFDHPEDRHDRVVDIDPAAFVRRHRGAFGAALLAASAALVALVALDRRLVLALAIAFGSSIFYMIRVPVLGKRLKELPFFKNIYAPAVLTTFTCSFLGLPFTRESGPVLAVVFFVIQINNITFDMKDVENDRRAGLRLISTTFSPRRVYAMLVGAALVGAALSPLALPRPWSIGAAAGFLALAGIVQRLSRRFSRRLLFVWCDGVLAVPLLVWAAGRLL